MPAAHNIGQRSMETVSYADMITVRDTAIRAIRRPLFNGAHGSGAAAFVRHDRPPTVLTQNRSSGPGQPGRQT